jgi:hypothetical protein
MHTVTFEWITKYQTKNGGYTRNQLALIGVDWPPVSGWKDRAVGLTIPDEDAEMFEYISRHSKTKQVPLDGII